LHFKLNGFTFEFNFDNQIVPNQRYIVVSTGWLVGTALPKASGFLLSLIK
jgi:hypothetical protein